MADFYHNTTFEEDFDTDTHQWCYNSTSLEAVPSASGQIVLISLYTLTSVLALVGNVTVIIVEIMGKESALNIRKYLINLAVSDVILGVFCVPFAYSDFMLGRWIFPHWLCPLAQFVQLLSCFVTSLTLTIIGIERFMATLHPFSWIHHWLECHTHIMLLLTWVFGAFYASIPLANTDTRLFHFDGVEYYECSYDIGASLLKRRLFMTFNFVLTFLLPLIVLIFTYSAIMQKLIAEQNQNVKRNFVSVRKDKAKQGEKEDEEGGSVDEGTRRTVRTIETITSCNSPIELRKSTPYNHRSKTIKMMFTVILLYGICWMPIKVYQFSLDYGFINFCTEFELRLFVCIYFTCHWIAMANSFVNPIIYSFMSKSFRNDFRQITQTFRKTLEENNFLSEFSLKTASTHV